MRITDDIIAEIQADERRRIIAAARKAAENAVPRETHEYLKGFQEGADFIFEEIEKAAQKVAA